MNEWQLTYLKLSVMIKAVTNNNEQRKAKKQPKASLFSKITRR